MIKAIVFTLLVSFLGSTTGFSQSNEVWRNLVGSAMLDNASYDVLERICDEAGGRLMGTPQNELAVNIMKSELERLGVTVRLETFEAPGWTRGKDIVEMIHPVKRTLRAKALGYVNKTPRFSAEVVYASHGRFEDYKSIQASGKIVLVTQEKPKGKQALLRYEAIDIAAEHGARAILFIIEKPGGTLMCGVSNFEGKPAAVPAYTMTYEEGKWMQRLLERNKKVELTIDTQSFCTVTESRNIVVTIPGKSSDKIVVGAHFDSWDVGNGGVDNGLGTAILYDVARLLSTYTSSNRQTIELVWFNGEELGLWGSKRYVEQHSDERILAMINMDMTGSPRGLNAMGFDEFIPMFEGIRKKLKGFNMERGVVSRPGTNSDHMHFMFKGIPTFSLQAHLDPPMYKYYHDLGDTFDKVNKQYLSEAAAVVSILTYELANTDDAIYRTRSEKEMIDLLVKHNLDKRLKRQKEWKFKE
jgi:Iap family predicted aminopeptidase